MSDLESLIAAAKADAPSAAARAKVWTGVAKASGVAAAGAGAVAGSASAAKMLGLGTLLGGALTIGVGGAMLFVGATPHLPGVNPGMRTETAARAPDSVTMVVRSAAIRPSSELTDSTSIDAPIAPTAARSVTRSVTSPSSGSTRTSSARGSATGGEHGHAPIASAPPSDGALAREASLLAGARRALAHGDALSALQIVRKLRALPAGQLVPEELAVEVQALRALGRNDDANEVEASLRIRFPDSVLAR
jgi:hypothetical protein